MDNFKDIEFSLTWQIYASSFTTKLGAAVELHLGVPILLGGQLYGPLSRRPRCLEDRGSLIGLLP